MLFGDRSTHTHTLTLWPLTTPECHTSLLTHSCHKNFTCGSLSICPLFNLSSDDKSQCLSLPLLHSLTYICCYIVYLHCKPHTVLVFVPLVKSTFLYLIACSSLFLVEPNKSNYKITKGILKKFQMYKYFLSAIYGLLSCGDLENH